jgi:cell division protein FtsW (lipid II flippase)
MAQIASRTPRITDGLRQYRWREMSLLVVPSIILLMSMFQLLLVNNLNLNSTVDFKKLPIGDGLIPILGYIAVTIVVHIILNIFFRKADQFLFPLVSLLTGLGIVMMTRLGPDLSPASPHEGTLQLLYAIIGIAICLATMFILRTVTWLARYKYSWMFLCFLLLAPSVVNGIISLKSGAPTRDTLSIGSIGIQPSEFLKIGLVIFFAAYLNDNRDLLAQGAYRIGWLRLPPLRQLGPLLLMLVMCLLCFLVIRELGLALLLYGLFLSMTYLATSKTSYVIFSLGAFVLFAAIGYALLSYVRQRFAVVTFNVTPTTWTAQDDAFYYGPGFQVIQGLINLASGGVLGSGLGMGLPTSTTFSQSDMVLTSYGEEFGLVGLFAIIGIYLLIMHRGFRIATEASDVFTKLLAAGLTCVFGIQTMIIIAGTTKMFPLSGIPLPFLSYGANSLVANFIIVGILLRISYNNAVEREGLY